MNLALALANKKMFSSLYGMRENIKKVLVLCTDGEESFRNPYEPSTDDELRKLEEKGLEKVAFWGHF